MDDAWRIIAVDYGGCQGGAATGESLKDPPVIDRRLNVLE
jgi:hypothetical protein